MSTLRSEPYNLLLNDLVIAKVEGINIIGNSVPSDENIGNARVRTEPLPPTVLVQRVDIGTTDVQIKVMYTSLPDSETGGSPILSLDLWYD